MTHDEYVAVMYAEEAAAEARELRLRRAARRVIAGCALAVLALASPPLAALLLLLVLRHL